MPAEPNKALRIVVPLIAIAGAIGLVIGVGMSSKRSGTPPQPAPVLAPFAAPTTVQSESTTPAQGLPEQVAASPERPIADASNGDAVDSDATDNQATGDPALPQTPTPVPSVVPNTLAARVWTGDVPPVVLGSLDPALGFELEIELTPYGAGVSKVTATNHFLTAPDLVKAQRNPAEATNHYVIQDIAEQPGIAVDGTTITYRMSAMGMTAATINGERIELFGGSYGRVWELESATQTTAQWKAEIVELATGATIAVLHRTVTLVPGTFEIVVKQSIENRSGSSIGVAWEQFGALDLQRDTSGYRIPMQRERFGYFRASQPGEIHADGKLVRRDAMFKHVKNGATKQEWPSTKYDDAGPLVWVAQTNRYFMAAVHPISPVGAAVPPDLSIGASVSAAVLWDDIDKNYDGDRVAHRLTSPIFPLAAGATQSLDVGLYAAPIDERRLEEGVDAAATAARLDKIVVYNMGGFCAFCTFAWLTDILTAILRFFDSFTGDWAVSIIMLVLCVRAALHPIFKKSQIGIQRFGKQMQRIAPKQKKLQEKYKDDPKRLHVEVRKLMREENVSYKGLFGCLPMFLQSPIWIALYALLYTNFDLRHEPAFYGLFQQFGGWPFFSDLSRGDSFIPLPFSFNMPLMGTITAINILPLLLGVVFFVHQKYLTPPPTATMTPEQESTQKIMKVMMVVMFPVFMYNAPAALTLYFVTNSTLGIVEGRWIRAHVNALELDGPAGADGRKAVTNTAGGKPSLEERLRARLEAKRPPNKK